MDNLQGLFGQRLQLGLRRTVKTIEEIEDFETIEPFSVHTESAHSLDNNIHLYL